jgi:hypothetical protein
MFRLLMVNKAQNGVSSQAFGPGERGGLGQTAVKSSTAIWRQDLAKQAI